MAPDSPPVHIAQEPVAVNARLWDTDSPPPADEIVRSQALLQLLSMLRDDFDDEPEGDASDDPWEDVNDEQDHQDHQEEGG